MINDNHFLTEQEAFDSLLEQNRKHPEQISFSEIEEEKSLEIEAEQKELSVQQLVEQFDYI